MDTSTRTPLVDTLSFPLPYPQGERILVGFLEQLRSVNSVLIDLVERYLPVAVAELNAQLDAHVTEIRLCGPDRFGDTVFLVTAADNRKWILCMWDLRLIGDAEVPEDIAHGWLKRQHRIPLDDGDLAWTVSGQNNNILQDWVTGVWLALFRAASALEYASLPAHPAFVPPQPDLFPTDNPRAAEPLTVVYPLIEVSRDRDVYDGLTFPG